MIRKIGGLYCVYSSKGKKMGVFTTLKAANKRLQQIEYFKYTRGK